MPKSPIFKRANKINDNSELSKNTSGANECTSIYKLSGDCQFWKAVFIFQGPIIKKVCNEYTFTSITFKKELST